MPGFGWGARRRPTVAEEKKVTTQVNGLVDRFLNMCLSRAIRGTQRNDLAGNIGSHGISIASRLTYPGTANWHYATNQYLLLVAHDGYWEFQGYYIGRGSSERRYKRSDRSIEITGWSASRETAWPAIDPATNHIIYKGTANPAAVLVGIKAAIAHWQQELSPGYRQGEPN